MFYRFVSHMPIMPHLCKRSNKETLTLQNVRVSLFYLLPLRIPDRTRRVVAVAFAPDRMRCALLIYIDFKVITKWEAITIGEDIGRITAHIRGNVGFAAPSRAAIGRSAIVNIPLVHASFGGPCVHPCD